MPHSTRARELTNTRRGNGNATNGSLTTETTFHFHCHCCHCRLRPAGGPSPSGKIRLTESTHACVQEKETKEVRKWAADGRAEGGGGNDKSVMGCSGSSTKSICPRYTGQKSPSEPILSKSLGQRRFRSSRRPAQTPPFPEAPTRVDLPNESLYKEIVGLAAPRD